MVIQTAVELLYEVTIHDRYCFANLGIIQQLTKDLPHFVSNKSVELLLFLYCFNSTRVRLNAVYLSNRVGLFYPGLTRFVGTHGPCVRLRISVLSSDARAVRPYNERGDQ